MKAGVKVMRDMTKQFKNIVTLIGKEGVFVGIPEGENSRDDGKLGNAAIGYIQEKGSEAAHIPPRPFLVPGINAVADKVADVLSVGLIDTLDKGAIAAIKTAQNKAGLIAQNSVRATMTAGDGYDQLAASTVKARERRGRSGVMKPLIDTGELRKSITYVVRPK